jgi:hypothetical protein
MMGGQVEDQGPALQLHQAHPDEEVEGPGGPGRRPSGRVGPSPRNPKAWGEGCGMLVVTSPETFCQGPHAGASQHGVVLDSSAPFWGKATAGYSARLGVRDHRIAFQPVGPQEGLLGEGVFGVSLAEGGAFRPGQEGRLALPEGEDDVGVLGVLGPQDQVAQEPRRPTRRARWRKASSKASRYSGLTGMRFMVTNTPPPPKPLRAGQAPGPRGPSPPAGAGPEGPPLPPPEG